MARGRRWHERKTLGQLQWPGYTGNRFDVICLSCFVGDSGISGQGEDGLFVNFLAWHEPSQCPVCGSEDIVFRPSGGGF
jgi:hypothetical protein